MGNGLDNRRFQHTIGLSTSTSSLGVSSSSSSRASRLRLSISVARVRERVANELGDDVNVIRRAVRVRGLVGRFERCFRSVVKAHTEVNRWDGARAEVSDVSRRLATELNGRALNQEDAGEGKRQSQSGRRKHVEQLRV